MGEEAYIEIDQWDEKQHYKDRDPPWIKLYNRLLDNHRWGRLPDASKGHYTGLLMLASRNANEIPLDVDWIANRIAAREPLDLRPLVSAGLISVYHRDSEPLSQHDSTPQAFARSREERREEAEKSKKTEDSSLRSSSSGEAGGDQSHESGPTPIEDMGGDQLLEAGRGAIGARYLPLTRETCFKGDNRPDAEARAVNMYEQMLKKEYGAKRIERALRGFRDLVDRGEVVWLEPGSVYPPWAMYNQKIGGRSAVMVAAERGREMESEGKPDDRVAEMLEGVG